MHFRQRTVLKKMFAAALCAADPDSVLPVNLPAPPHQGKTLVVGAGKAAEKMARALEKHWPGDMSGAVAIPYGDAKNSLNKIRLMESAHPIPDRASVQAAKMMMAIAESAGSRDLVIALISGGGSSLLALPTAGATLADKRIVTRRLLRAGAGISEINCVRRDLSDIKGGRLAAAASPARIVTLAVSDVPGDDPAVIASGPTAPPIDSPSGFAVAKKYKIALPPRAEIALKRNAKRKPPKVAGEFRVIASPLDSLRAAAEAAKEAGYFPVILGDKIEGESKAAADSHGEFALQCKGESAMKNRIINFMSRDFAIPPDSPLALISGGETTVTFSSQIKKKDFFNRGGRNTEFALALALKLKGVKGVAALAADTDGLDGDSQAAGAFVFSDTIARAIRRGINCEDSLRRHDSASVFQAVGDLLITGATGANVSDFRAILIERPRRR